MERYNQFQNSDTKWFDNAPSHWHKSKNKFILNEKSDEVGELSKNYTLLSLTKKGVIIRDVESGKGKFPSSFDKYKIVNRGDLIFCLYDIEETPRTIGLSYNDGMITGSYKIFSTVNSVNKYIYYYYLNIDDFKGLKPFYTGLRNVVRADTFNDLTIYLPPLKEQEQIVAFLDDKTAKIDDLLAKTKKKIELLKEKRTALINHCVTKGLNPNAPMKDSGVEWIGEIPSGWIIGKLYQYSEMNSGSTPSRVKPEYWENGTIPWMSSGEINKKKIKEIDGRITQLGFTNSSTKILPIGTVMIGLNGQGKTKGTVGILEIETSCNQSLCGMIFNNRFIPMYSYYFLHSQYKTLRGLVGEGKREGISVSFLGRFPICVPQIPEQQQIVNYLDEQTAKIDATISKEQKRIELLKEYRQSLISNVVTGKIKVCN